MKVTTIILLLLLLKNTVAFPTTESAKKVLCYSGTSDISAGVAISKDMFIVGDDENNILRVYQTDRPGSADFSYDLTDFLEIDPQYPEADIEGATIVGDRIYWITSHGRNKDGKIRPNRYRFFATKIKFEKGHTDIEPVGRPCKTLIHNLVRHKSLQHLKLEKVTRFSSKDLTKKEREKLAPKEKGLNVEALCASADGKILYIGFRNPRPIDKPTRHPRALVVPLLNPIEVIKNVSEPIFGEPLLWDLAGLGIRSMEYSNYHSGYFIIAGYHNEDHKFALYSWSGKQNNQPALIRNLNTLADNFTPEALIPFENIPRLLLLSDDGSLNIKISNPSECKPGELNDDGTCPNKFLTDPNKKTFRAIWLEP
jgi:hypothetical protein